MDIILYFYNNLWQAWALVAVACLAIEMASGGCYMLSIAAGAAVAAIFSLFAGPAAQLGAFVVASLLFVFFIRPAALRWLYRSRKARPSNAEALLGRTGTVSEAIAPGGFGRVLIDGDDWKATTDDGEELPEGAMIKVVGRESIIIKVTKHKTKEQ